MRKFLTGCIAAISLVAPATAAAHDGGSIEHKNEYLRAKVIALGASPGRDIVKHGRRKQDASVKEYFTTMRRMIAPPPAPAPAAPAATASTATVQDSTSPSYSAPTPSSGGGGGCVGMEAESGADGYNAYNPNGGYIGCYQIAPQHYSSGVCSGLGTDPSGQDACAGRICDSQGPSAWTNPSGQNPCGRLGG